MERERELTLFGKAEGAALRVKGRLQLTGVATEWHCRKANHMLRDPARVHGYVGAGTVVEGEEGAYVGKLRGWLEEIRIQDGRCQKLWQEGRGARERYEAEREKLVWLFDRLMLRAGVYELRARVPDRPYVGQAAKYLESGNTHADERAVLEGILRASLEEVVEWEKEIAGELAAVDVMREEIFAAHEGWALEIARAMKGEDAGAAASARGALRKAMVNYEYRRGYRFRTYAKLWVADWVRKGKRA